MKLARAAIPALLNRAAEKQAVCLSEVRVQDKKVKGDNGASTGKDLGRASLEFKVWPLL